MPSGAAEIFMFRQARALLGQPRSRRGGCAVLAAVAMLAFGFAPRPARAGLLDFLFDPKAPVWNPFAPTPQQAQPTPRSAPVVQRKKSRKSVARTVRLRDKTRASGLPPASHDFLDDGSLRGGDAIMTPNGIRIFTGPPGRHHRLENFARVNEIEGLGKQERSALIALDSRASGFRAKNAERNIATGRSAAMPLATGARFTDPRGRTIRYVGP
jgi:hypothetical protein